jgi:hypothetical protein
LTSSPRRGLFVAQPQKGKFESVFGNEIFSNKYNIRLSVVVADIVDASDGASRPARSMCAISCEGPPTPFKIRMYRALDISMGAPSTSILLKPLIVISNVSTCIVPYDRAHPRPLWMTQDSAGEHPVPRYSLPNSSREFQLS